MKVTFKLPSTNVRLDTHDKQNFIRRRVGGHEFFSSRQAPFLALATPDNFPATLGEMQQMKKIGIFLLAVRRAEKGSAYLMFDHQYALYAWHDAAVRGELAPGKAEVFHVDSHNDVDSFEPFNSRQFLTGKVRERPNLRDEKIETDVQSIAMGLSGNILSDFNSYLAGFSRLHHWPKFAEHNFMVFARALFGRKHDVYFKDGSLYIEEDTPWHTEGSFQGRYMHDEQGFAIKNWERKPVSLEELSRHVLTANACDTALDVDADAFEAGRKDYFVESKRWDHAPTKNFKIIVGEEPMKEFAGKFRDFRGTVTLAASPNYTHGDTGLLGVRRAVEVLI